MATIKYSIYCLIDEGSGSIFYIGATKQLLNRRLSTHISPCKINRDSDKAKIIRSILSRGEKPGIYLLKECDENSWEEAERFYISYFRSLGCNLTNMSIGGHSSSGVKRTKEQRDAVSKKLKGRSFNKGIKRTQEFKDNISRKRKGIPNIHVRKLSEGAIREIRILYNSEKHTQKELSTMFGVTQANINKIVNKKTWKI